MRRKGGQLTLLPPYYHPTAAFFLKLCIATPPTDRTRAGTLRVRRRARTPSHARGRRPPAPPAPGNRARCIPFLFAVDRVRLRAYYGSTGLRFHGRIGAAAGLVYCQVLSLWTAFKPRSSSKLKLGRSELFASSLSLHTLRLSLHTFSPSKPSELFLGAFTP